jgi:hypothetical protein
MLKVKVAVRCSVMAGEFERQLKQIKPEDLEKVLALLNSAGKEFPCLSCASGDECATFQWFVKWFGQPATS